MAAVQNKTVGRAVWMRGQRKGRKKQKYMQFQSIPRFGCEQAARNTGQCFQKKPGGMGERE